MVVIHNLLNGNSWSISKVCCWCNDTYYVLFGLYDDFSCWLSFARLARIYPLYCCCNCDFIFYISILSGVIQVCSILKPSLKMRSSMTKIRSFVCELDLRSFSGIKGIFKLKFVGLWQFKILLQCWTLRGWTKIASKIRKKYKDRTFGWIFGLFWVKSQIWERKISTIKFTNYV